MIKVAECLLLPTRIRARQLWGALSQAVSPAAIRFQPGIMKSSITRIMIFSESIPTTVARATTSMIELDEIAFDYSNPSP